jgi:hypothetical protein
LVFLWSVSLSSQALWHSWDRPCHCPVAVV